MDNFTVPDGYCLIADADRREMEVESHKLLDNCRKLSEACIQQAIQIQVQADEIESLKKQLQELMR